jgi:hypothetical protein
MVTTMTRQRQVRRASPSLHCSRTRAAPTDGTSPADSNDDEWVKLPDPTAAAVDGGEGEWVELAMPATVVTRRRCE